MKNVIFFTGLFCFLFLTFPCVAFAQHTDNVNVSSPSTQNGKRTIEDEIVVLIGLKRYEEACLLLDQYFPIATAKDEALFLHARCRMGVRDYQVARELYKILEISFPGSTVVERELALVDKLIKKDSSWSKEELSILENVFDFEYVDRSEKNTEMDNKSWFASIATGVIYDTNINTGPNSSDIILADSSAIDAVGYKVSGFWGYLHSIGRTDFLLAKIRAEYIDYMHGQDNSFGSYSAGIGPIYFNKKWNVSVIPGVTWQTYGGRPYSNAVDLSVDANYELNEKISLGISAVTAQNTYLELEGYDGNATRLSPSVEAFTSIANRELKAKLSGILKREDTEDPVRSSWTVGNRVDMQYQVMDDVKVSSSVQNVTRNFDQAELIFSADKREDHQLTTSLELSVDVSSLIDQDRVSLNTSYLFINNRSNVDAYSYKRGTTTVSLVKDW